MIKRPVELMIFVITALTIFASICYLTYPRLASSSNTNDDLMVPSLHGPDIRVKRSDTARIRPMGWLMLIEQEPKMYSFLKSEVESGRVAWETLVKVDDYLKVKLMLDMKIKSKRFQKLSYHPIQRYFGASYSGSLWFSFNAYPIRVSKPMRVIISGRH